jgi:ABC-type branched-subunit amino acid transport system substrate-binding protein
LSRTFLRLLGALLLAALVPACAPQRAPVQPGIAAPAPPPAAGSPRQRIGLLLPLSGRQAATGRVLAQAAQAAFIEAADERIELVMADSAGTPDQAARGAAELAGKGVAIVVGPLFGSEVRAAAGPLRAAGIPLLALSSDRTVAEPGAWVTGLLPEDQVRAGLAFVRAAGAARLALLGTDDASGRAFANAARAIAPDLGIELARVALVPPGTEPAAALAQVAAVPQMDTLLLSDAGGRLRLVAAQAGPAGLDPTTLRLVGPAAWAAEPLLLSEPALAGALFAAPDEAAWEALAGRLAQAFANRPPRLSLIAHDAMLVAVAALRQTPAGPVAPATLAAEEGFAAATGRIRLLADGRSQRQLRIYQAAPGGLRNLGPAPFDPPVAALARPAPRG